MSPVRMLVVSDTHVGYDFPARPRSGRRVRGQDFVDNFQAALQPAHEGVVDIVVHAGDVFDHPEPSPAVADIAYGLLRAVAERGIPVVVIPGNHERARLPCPLLIMHQNIHRLDRARTVMLEVRGTSVAVGGFPYARKVRRVFPGLVRETRLQQTAADVKVLVVHHCIEGAKVSLPEGGSFTFRDAPDVIATRDLPSYAAAVVSGHLHRHQVLRQGTPCPVVYGGSVERTAFAEMHETKGFVILTFDASEGGGELREVDFRALPARPMVRASIDPEGDVPAQAKRAIAAADPNAIVRLEVKGPTRSLPGLRAGVLRSLAPSTMNVHVVFADREPRFAPLSRARRRVPTA
ncbi:MAG: exonuclease SbcCD subunit D [Myxococcota bacterium]